MTIPIKAWSFRKVTTSWANSPVNTKVYFTIEK
jgi:hypothetical protein